MQRPARGRGAAGLDTLDDDEMAFEFDDEFEFELDDDDEIDEWAAELLTVGRAEPG